MAPANGALNESRISELGWTDAHFVAYGWPIDDDNNEGDLEAVNYLEMASPEFLCQQNDFGQTALHLAVRQNRLALVGLYTEQRLCLNIPNKDGDTPLHYAAFWGREEAASMLVDAGADVLAKNHLAKTPIDDAQSRNEEAIVAILKSAATAHTGQSA